MQLKCGYPSSSKFQIVTWESTNKSPPGACNIFAGSRLGGIFASPPCFSQRSPISWLVINRHFDDSIGGSKRDFLSENKMICQFDIPKPYFGSIFDEASSDPKRSTWVANLGRFIRMIGSFVRSWSSYCFQIQFILGHQHNSPTFSNPKFRSVSLH